MEQFDKNYTFNHKPTFTCGRQDGLSGGTFKPSNGPDFIHTFAVCAYKDSPYLEQCLESVLSQTVKTNVIICTSTPSQYISELARAYQVPLFIREGKSDIRDDWNFACRKAKTDLVTVAHQDDVYEPDYVKCLLKAYKAYPDMTMAFTDYRVLKTDTLLEKERSSSVKRLLLLPLRCTRLADRGWIKKLGLAFGNAICCPSVTYRKSRVGDPVFQSELKYGLDWDTFLRIARLPGRFVYIPRNLLRYRIHEGATSKECIVDQRRITEDREMFRRFWPKWVVSVIMKFYTRAYSAYDDK